MIVVKLGGSVITDKSRAKSLRRATLARVTSEIASSERAVCLVHGAGSFGHPLAKAHALADGRRGDRAQDAAAAEVHRDVRELHAEVLRDMQGWGARAIGVSSWDVAVLARGALDRFDVGPYARALDCGLVPVGFGDLVPDRERGYGILSGDVVVERLALDLKPARVVIATDVDGLYDAPPHEPGARLLARVTAEEAVRVLAGASQGIDVTGGMAGKVARLAAIARAGVPVRVVNGSVPGRIADAMAGQGGVGTDVVRE